MKDYVYLREKAIALRKRGDTYSEILSVVKIAKSTLSIWLKNIGLAKSQKQRITEKRLAAQKRGAESRRQQRIRKQEFIYKNAEEDVTHLSKRDLWLCGIMLYWAEGTKEKEDRPGVGIQFSNSDPRMIKLFVKWLREIIKISSKEIIYELYVHKDRKEILPNIKKFWSRKLRVDMDKLRTYFKSEKRKKVKIYKVDFYTGLIKVKVRESSELNRRVDGWVRAIAKYWEIV